MLFYFIIFFIIGFGLGVVIRNIKIALGIVVAITLCWTFAYGPWALAAFIELMLGVAVARVVRKEVKQCL